MELKKQELLRRFTDPAEKERDSVCVMCRAKNTKTFLFPTCRIVHSFACEGCIPEILRYEGSACSFPSCINDNLLREEFRKTVEQHNGGATAYTQTIDLLTLTIPGRWPKPVLLKEETVVTLKNIALSEVLLFKLLKKTHVVVGENVSVFGNFKGEDCIRAGTDFEGLRLLRPASFQEIQISVCFMENITRMPNKSIKIGKSNRLGLPNCSINILPKLKMHEDNEMEGLELHILKTKHISEAIRTRQNRIWLGEMKNLKLRLFAINTLHRLVLHEENEMERCFLNAEKDESIFEAILTKNNSIWLGKVNNLDLELFAISILPKLKLHEENEMEEFSLSADKEEYVSEVTRAENNSIYLGKVKKLELRDYAVNALPKLKLHRENEMEKFCLNADRIEHVSEIILAENNSIHTGKLKNLKLWEYAINVLPKLHGENEIEELVITGVGRGYCSNDVFSSDSDFFSWKIKRLKIENSAVDILKIRKRQDCLLELLEFVPQKGEKFSYLKTRIFLSRIDIGKVRQDGFFVPKEIRPKLKYTLVDEKGNEVVKKKSFFIW
ncbi:MAG: uncharacterized protein A8A55_1858 [Amphiamblys sp. WSBS2006]|nr:MAG: uncharacterized protein A8A55_1858 [Amphiamblys sp. WSBS2006]